MTIVLEEIDKNTVLCIETCDFTEFDKKQLIGAAVSIRVNKVELHLAARVKCYSSNVAYLS
jgi:hypothetical protein